MANVCASCVQNMSNQQQKTMKKVLLIFFSCLFAFAIQAQSEHLKFMGIPLDGKIKDFHSQLKKKGCTIDKYTMFFGKPKGKRIYEGSFAGSDAMIAVFYNEKTKMVYRAKAVIETYSEEQVKQKYSEIKSMLMDKYDIHNRFRQKYGEELRDSLIGNLRWYFEDTEDKYESISFMVIGVEPFERIGEIDLYVRESNSSYNNRTEYNLHIDYIDRENNIAEHDDRMDDL